jgi:citrate synthase
MGSSRSHLSAADAARALGVTRPTLYAYVSRGQLRSEPIPGHPRARRYYREDVARLQQIKAARRDPQAVGAHGLHWGGPVLESAVTLIDAGRLYFRGRDAIAFAESATVEDAAALLWAIPDAERTDLFHQAPVLSARDVVRIRALTRDALAQMQAALAIAASIDVAAHDLSARSVRHTGARILRLLTEVCLLQTPATVRAADAIRTALVLCADHELNVSAFTARCAASAGASPYDVVSAALAALKGHRHGGASVRALALLRDARSVADARGAIASRLRLGESVAGFGHPLYPDGDPRAVLLLKLARASGRELAWRTVRNAWRAGARLLDQKPNLDFGLAAITYTYGLPDEAPLVLFALGRTVGWLAHAIEEYASGQLIRPRARYVGLPPSR